MTTRQPPPPDRLDLIHPLIAAAVRVVADGSTKSSGVYRTLVRRDLLAQLRQQLDLAGFADHWRVEYERVRAAERAERAAAAARQIRTGDE